MLHIHKTGFILAGKAEKVFKMIAMLAKIEQDMKIDSKLDTRLYQPDDKIPHSEN